MYRAEICSTPLPRASNTVNRRPQRWSQTSPKHCSIYTAAMLCTEISNRRTSSCVSLCLSICLPVTVCSFLILAREVCCLTVWVVIIIMTSGTVHSCLVSTSSIIFGRWQHASRSWSGRVHLGPTFWRMAGRRGSVMVPFERVTAVSKSARTIIVSKATRVSAQALYNHRGKKC